MSVESLVDETNNNNQDNKYKWDNGMIVTEEELKTFPEGREFLGDCVKSGRLIDETERSS